MQDEILKALAQGSLLLTANRRLARQWRGSYDGWKRESGAMAWEAPAVRAWADWVGESIDGLLPDRVIPGAFAELRGWRKVIGGGELLDEQATAAMAAQAYGLAEQYRVPLDHPTFGWAEDTAKFREWARTFQERSERKRWLPLAMRERWLAGNLPESGREVWLDGFDETTPAERGLMDRLRVRVYAGSAVRAQEVSRCELASPGAEVAAAARWARGKLERGEAETVGVVVQKLGELRAEVEAVFGDVFGAPVFNVSLGRPLAEWPVVADGLGWLGWLRGPLEIGAAGVLVRSPYLGGAAEEGTARAAFDFELRSANVLEVRLERVGATGPAGLAAMAAASLAKLESLARQQTPSGWARAIPELLRAAGWPGERTQSSAERQAVARWEAVLREFAVLDVVEGRIGFGEAVTLLEELAGSAVFQPETEERPVQILEALQAAGSRFDAMWVMGMTDTAWPGPARPNPFLPRSLQREFDLPHATPERELRFAREVTERLLRSAGTVRFSHAAREGEEELRPSRLIVPFDEVPAAEAGERLYAIGARLEELADDAGPAVEEGAMLRGGTNVLSWQSQCPFRAFAAVRLRAEEWPEPEPGLTPMEKGTALHGALAVLWRRFGTRAALAGASWEERDAAMNAAAAAGIGELAAAGRERLIELERVRLRAVLADWIELDCERGEFTVEAVEKEIDLGPLGLPLRARADRIDRLPGGETVLIDYKSTSPSRSVWEGERPDNLQMPLYAAALGETPGAMVFAQLKRGEHRFVGMGASDGLLPGVKSPERPWQEQIALWRGIIDRIWGEFQAGVATVDPKEQGKPCRNCHLHGLCRIGDAAAVENEDPG